MGAKQSAEVTKALRLLDDNPKMKPPEAARLSDCSKQAVYYALERRKTKGTKNAQVH